MDTTPCTPRRRISPPSYARPTVASASKSSRKSPVASTATANSTLKDPSTPSRSSNPHRIPMHFRTPPSDAPIKSAPGQVCHLARLPAELRTMVYDFVIEPELDHYIDRHYRSRQWRPGRTLTVLSLAHVCRRIRYEVSYEFYRRAHISTYAAHNDYFHVMAWFRHLTPLQRAAVSRNPNFTVGVHPSAYSPVVTNEKYAWAVTRNIGNIYEVSPPNRGRFLRLGSLVTWFRFISQPPLRDMEFKYYIAMEKFHYWGPLAVNRFGADDVDEVLRQTLGPLWGESGRRAQLNGEQKEAVVRGVERMVKSLEEIHAALGMDFGKWHRQVKHLRRSLLGDSVEASR
ncbi:uncharacterized protein BDZ99DRAFT_499689 [Mytilinidion resinicola]|uniref:F-box domain-containing protein n=1 Tax=Mytilinidion resinicola TaxID=574789 RepID=A0A6A6YK67_9PEZI|nr:uncharacterized protein BDZ99DRAFT_499689 [Mytilinidion resinicola]KAF2808355.1 hypothetical protein BDZ99DRAFT_499689 [Mytilinidion resinicola]